MKKAEAYQLGETKKREAEAAVLEAQNRAMAKAALAEAERIEAEKRAVSKPPAKAEKAKIIVDAEAAAERVKLEAQAAAATIYAKLEAEARGQYEILAKKGEGLKKVIAACGGSRPPSSYSCWNTWTHWLMHPRKAISNIKFDKVVVWEGGGANGTSNTAAFIKDMARDDAADAPGDEGHRRRRDAGLHRQADRRRSAGRRQARLSSPNGAVPAAVGGERRRRCDSCGPGFATGLWIDPRQAGGSPVITGTSRTPPDPSSPPPSASSPGSG